MWRFLQEAGVPVSNESLSSSTTYHLEVKTTRGHCNTEFRVGKYQLEKVKFEVSSGATCITKH